MKQMLEFILATIHIIFAIIAINSDIIMINIITSIISILFLIAALKIADCDIYIVRNYENNKTAKI